MRVAAALWDMYDVPNDGPNSSNFDNLYYINQATPVALYTEEPQERDVRRIWPSRTRDNRLTGSLSSLIFSD